ncbi:MAG TPA: hypothetical protein VGN01_06245 [Acidobacteriaceae bacterium]|jgi:hypothetical protein
MAPQSDSANREERKAPFSLGEFLFRIAKPLFVGLFAILLFVLGEAMVHSRFFQGSRSRSNGTVGQ